MKFSEICNKQLKISKIGMGCAGIGNTGKIISNQTAFDIVNASQQTGTNYYDTSPWYGTGLSEVRLGLALHDHQNFVISTKVGRYLVPTCPTVPNQAKYLDLFKHRYPNRVVFDYSYQAILQQYHESLIRLGKHKIDLLVIHDLDPSYQQNQFDNSFNQLFNKNGGIDALKYLKSTNKITGFGAGINCNEPKDYIQKYISKLVDNGVDFLILAGSPTLLDQSILDIQEIKKVDIILASPYNSGILAGGSSFYYSQANDQIKNKIKKIQDICHKFKVDIKSVALNYPFQFSQIKAVLPGPLSVQQVEENCKAFIQDIPNDLWNELRQQDLIK